MKRNPSRFQKGTSNPKYKNGKRSKRRGSDEYQPNKKRKAAASCTGVKLSQDTDPQHFINT
eukprot:UN14629